MREYFHETQQQVLYTPAKDIVLCAGRGWGKGPIHAAINLRNMQRMPGSITGFVAANCKRALTNTIPYMNDDVQDIQFEDADFNEDDIFNPKKLQEEPKP